MSSPLNLPKLLFAAFSLLVALHAADVPEAARQRQAMLPRFPDNHATIDAHLENLDSKDRFERNQAIVRLGYWQRADATEALTKLMREHLASGSGFEGGMHCSGGENRIYTVIQPEVLLVSGALAKQGILEALPLLKQAHRRFMKMPLKQRSMT
ncbi:MAG: hypothetical protein ACI8W8_002965, partial [Rhodothermales bacterium]